MFWKRWNRFCPIVYKSIWIDSMITNCKHKKIAIHSWETRHFVRTCDLRNQNKILNIPPPLSLSSYCLPPLPFFFDLVQFDHHQTSPSWICFHIFLCLSIVSDARAPDHLPLDFDSDTRIVNTFSISSSIHRMSSSSSSKKEVTKWLPKVQSRWPQPLASGGNSFF